MVTKQAFIETLYEMLDEYDWGAINWPEDPEFRRLLSDAWERVELTLRERERHVRGHIGTD